jgi:hypothetical protein
MTIDKSKDIMELTRTNLNNKTDTIISNNEGGTCMLIDVAISGDRNLFKKYIEVIK